MYKEVVPHDFSLSTKKKGFLFFSCFTYSHTEQWKHPFQQHGLIWIGVFYSRLGDKTKSPFLR